MINTSASSASVRSTSPGGRIQPLTQLNYFSQLVGSQIRFLVTNLNKKNYKASVAEIHHLVDLYGHDAYLFLLRSLVSNIDFKEVKQKDQLRIQLLNQETVNLLRQPNFASCICQALDGIESVQEDFISQFSKVLKLPLAQEILISVGLCHSVDPNLKAEALKYLKTKLNELSPSATKSIPENVLHSLLYTLRTEGLIKQAQNVMKALQKVGPLPQTLTPLLTEGDPSVTNSKEIYTKENRKNQNSESLLNELTGTNNVSSIMEDIGYGCTETAAAFREFIGQFPELTESDVAQILGMLARTYAGLETAGVPLYKDFPPNVDFTAAEKTETAKTWNLNVVIDVLKESYPKLNWPLVARNLDYPGFYVPDAKGLALIMGIFRKSSKDPFPLEFLFEQWKNSSGQLSILKLAVNAPPDMFNFAQTSRKIDAEGLPTVVGKNVPSLHQSWYSLSLIETLLRLAEVENYAVVRQIFNYPIKHCPELLSIGLAQSKTSWNTLAVELSSLLLPNILISNNAASNYTIHKLWALNPSMLVRGMAELQVKDPASLSRVLEIATQDLKALTPILDARPFSFVIELASLASRREFLNLDKWLQDKINEHGAPFLKACLGYVRSRFPRLIKGESQRLYETLAIFLGRVHQNVNALAGEPLEEFKAMFGKFQTLAKPPPSKYEEGTMPPGSAPPMTTTPPPTEVPIASPPSMAAGTQLPSSMGVQAILGQPKPPGSQQQNVQGQPGGANPNANPTGENRVFPTEIEEVSNAFFQRIYTGQLPIDELIGTLTKFKNSKDKREQDVFACMIHNLFDEYRFFPKYPDKELQITGMLFGALIQHQLVSFLPLGVALRYVLDALRKTPGSKMFKFGLTALEQFKPRLPEWPQYCSHILAIPGIKKVQPDLVDFIQTNLPSLPPSTTSPPSGLGTPGGPTPTGQQAPSTPNSSSANLSASSDKIAPQQQKPDPSRGPAAPAQAPATSQPVDTSVQKTAPSDILYKSVSPPPSIDEIIKDKIHFVFNNVSQVNMDQKVGELKSLFKDEDIVKYTAYYLVVKRIGLEYNFHSLYQAVLEKLKLPKLNQYLLSSTFEAIRGYLRSETIVINSEEKAILKNLGNWLGLMTLARNKPLLQKDLALKELIFEGYEYGRLVVVIPFVCKILESCAVSKVFKPPNPWLVAIVRLLAEVYRKQNLRQTLKFEIEFICKTLELDLNEVKPSDSLKDKNQYVGPNNMDFKPPPQPPSGAVDMGRDISPKDTRGRPPVAPDMSAMSDPNIELNEDPFVQQLAAYLAISTNIPLFNQQVALKRLVPIAMDRAIREILSPVVERSVTIACITTREIVMKDFAMEPDEQKMRKAAHLMVQNLAGSLALVTCKEPLRVSMNNHLRSLLQTHTPEQYHPLVEQAVQTVSAENLDLACTLIEKAATEKAVRDTDESLTAAFMTRKKHRERGGLVQPFIDVAFAGGRYPSLLPENLRPKLGGLLSHQLRVYDDFSRIPYLQQPTQPNYPASQQFPDQGMGQQLDRRSPPMFEQETLTTPQAVEKFMMILDEIDNICHMFSPSVVLTNLPPDHAVFQLLSQIPILINQSMSRTEVALAFAQRVFKSLYDSETPLYLDIRFSILETITSLNQKITKEITTWLLYLDEERKYSRVLVPRLIKSQLLSVPDLDSHLAKMIETARSKPALDFALFLIRQCLLEGRYMVPTELRETLELVNKMSRAKGQEELAKLIEEVKSKVIQPAKKAAEAVKLRTQLQTDFNDPPGTKEEVVRVFEEWLLLFTTPNQSENTLASHVAQLQSGQGVLKDEESSSRFFRICTELAVENCTSEMANTKSGLSYTAVDAFSKLVVILIKYSESPNIKISIISRALGVVVRALIRDYDIKRTKFNQRPFFRLFANWLIDLNVPDPSLDAINLQILLAFSNAFMMLQPSRLPAFSFAWLELISHRMFMPKLLLSKGQKGWPLFQRLLVELFKFLEPYLRNADLSESIRMLYKGTLRVLLVLLHDFPEFLCDYHFGFCDVIPPSCIQMRNLILSAFPRNMRLPDPFTPNLKVDLLPEINQSPRILSNYTNTLGSDLLGQVDSYLKNRAPVTFLLELKSRLMYNSQEASQIGIKYNLTVINALVLHVGIQAISQLQNKQSQVPPSMTHSAPMDIFQHLASDLDTEGRYLFLNAIANQLRYPNNHTHYFSCVLLYLFAEATQEVIQEQITRVLLERLIVNRPHPWGLLITFIELIKNPRYSFWSHGFTRCAPEIERLFESVARSCMGPQVKPPTEEQ